MASTSIIGESTGASDVHLLAGSALLYALGTFGAKAIGFLLLPVYTRFLEPADFGIIAVTSAVAAIFLIVTTLSLHGSVTYLYFQAGNDAERRKAIGTVWLGLSLSAVVLTVLADWAGSRFALDLFRDVPFHPYLRIAIWIALITSFTLVPLSLLQSMERPRSYVMLSLAGAALTAGFVVWQVVFLQAGALGYLQGMLFAGLVMLVPHLTITLRNIRPALQFKTLSTALVYSLPLVPHGLASWMLELSDRVILERFVPLAQVGVYSLGYMLSTVVYLLAVAVNNAWVPYMFKRTSDQGPTTTPDFAVFTTYYFALIVWVGLGLALLARPVLVLFATPAYFGAAEVMPWIVAGMVLHAIYFIPVGFLFRYKRTVPIATATVIAGLVNIAMNLVLVPYYGIIGAAFATFLSYFVMLALVWAAARRVFPITYEYGRLAIIASTAVCLFFLAGAFSLHSLASEVVAKGTLCLAFPALLWVMGVMRSQEQESVRLLWRQRMRWSRRS